MPVTWACPFWKWEDGLKVYCSGGRIDFPNAEAREDYIYRYCAYVPGWEDCTLAANLIRDYERSCRDMAGKTRNVDQIKELKKTLAEKEKELSGIKYELGRYEKKTRDQFEELRAQRKAMELHRDALNELSMTMDAICIRLALEFGGQNGEGDTVLYIPSVNVRELLAKYEIKTTRADNMTYCITVRERKAEVESDSVEGGH